MNVRIGCLSLLAAVVFDAHAQSVVRIGVAMPLTGPVAHLGKDVQNGAQLAVDDLNRAPPAIGGKPVKFELVVEDDQGDPRQAVQVAQRLVDARVAGVVGDLNSGPTIVAAKVYAAAGIAQIAPAATNPAYTQQGYKTAFRLMATDSQQGASLAALAAKLAKGGPIALIDDRGAYGQGLIDQAEKTLRANGVTRITRDYTTDTAVNFASILTRVKGEHAAVIVYGGADAQAGPMVRQMKALGIDAAFVGGDGVCTGQWTALSSGANEGQFCTQAGDPRTRMAGYAAFERRFEARYGKVIVFAPYGYDAVMLLADAMRRANSTDPAVYLGALAKTRYDGVIGSIRFNPQGDNVNGAVTVYRVQRGALVPVPD
ncbi:receptor ligand binding region family protein [Burkholderia thailandensis MSMB121]|uniref:branched-chain amino acid ABC transporter substrate-binding protein n=1 Tax=Burkholderia TaxID=32008 RepID=UPI0003280FC8|nr:MULTISPECIES: branched-chain amino acid ABC transporter substrate-binding protein [Burkholderia]AGK47298.1 receptor ligand binding region family protein [Burkholderia thailandensis MSMB121]ATF37058.1 branched-chain amino acid ABC transporter substrate-binding protein [Burkholderia thailandensis]KST74425.1 branched chain amino acid ABC transporter substrate-binding protein [Burkholderia humptydooensis]